MAKRTGNWNPGNHLRNIGPMLASLRCSARTRRGTSCRSPATRGKVRCRMHGGAKGSGAPHGNRNAWKHGRYTAVVIAKRKQFRVFFREMRDGLAAFKEEAFAKPPFTPAEVEQTRTRPDPP